MLVSLLVAMSDAGVIGRDGGLPWRLSADLRRFRRLTAGHAIIMGRKTYDSIGRPLPDRTMIVVTRQAGFAPPSVLVSHSVEEALRLARQEKPDDEEVFIVGGAEIYRQTLPLADRMYVTLVHAEVAGDTWFPDFDRRAWRVVEREDYQADDKNEYDYSFVRYDRIDARRSLPDP